jgi:hypothetical protein
MLKMANFFSFEFLNFFLLLVLWLLEEASVVTPLPTNNAKIGGVGKSETKWGMMYHGTGFKALFFSFFRM